MFTSLQASRRRTTSSAIAAALVIAGLSFAASPAYAATVLIKPANLDTSETRATGHNDFLPGGGVRVWTEGNTSTDKAAGYFAVNQALASSGEPSMDAEANDMTTTLLPGMQLVTDFDNDGSLDGILVGEPTYANGSPLYGANWWLTNSAKAFVKAAAPTVGGGGNTWNGSLDQWRTAFPNAQIKAFGWSLGSGVKGDTTIHSMTLGPNTYLFTTGAPVTPDVSGTGPLNKQVKIVSGASDPDGGKLTYKLGKVNNGFGHIQPTGTIVFNPYYGFVGTTSFTYTARDASGLTSTGTVTVTITKAPSTLKLAKQFGPKGKVNINVTIQSAGQARGGTITIKEGVTTVATKVATSQSNPIQFPATNGSHTYDVTFGGSAQAEPASGSITVTVP